MWTFVNSLWPSDAMWRQRTGSTLAQVTACCLTAPSHYLIQCWLIMNLVLWHPPETNFIGKTEFESYHFKIITTSLRGQWVKCLHLKTNEGIWQMSRNDEGSNSLGSHFFKMLTNFTIQGLNQNMSCRCVCLVTWFCYRLIAKPGDKTASPPWPGPVFYLCLRTCLETVLAKTVLRHVLDRWRCRFSISVLDRRSFFKFKFKFLLTH